MADAPAAPAAPTPPASDAPPEGQPPAGDEPTVESLQQEVDKWKALSRQNEAASKKAATALEKAQQASMSEQEKAVAEAKAQGRAEAITEVQRDRVRDKVEIAAAGKLADPGDAAALLGDLDRFLNSGEIDTKAISVAIDDLVKAKPYLSPAPGSGAGEGGPRGNADPPALNGDPLLKDIKQALNIK